MLLCRYDTGESSEHQNEASEAHEKVEDRAPASAAMAAQEEVRYCCLHRSTKKPARLSRADLCAMPS